MASYKHHLLLLLSFALNASPPPAQARPLELQTNIREGCRQEMAGAYLKTYDDREKNRTLIVQVKDALKSLEGPLQTAREAHATQVKIAKASAYSAQHAADEQQAESRVNTLVSQKLDYEMMLQQAMAATETLIAKEKSLKQSLAKVFTFERVGDTADGGYPIRLDYRASCPKFRHVCPLPAMQRRDLLAIDVDGGTPESCRRYAMVKEKPGK